MIITILLVSTTVDAQQHVFRSFIESDAIWQTDVYKKLGVKKVHSQPYRYKGRDSIPGQPSYYAKVRPDGQMKRDSAAGKSGWVHQMTYDDRGRLITEYYRNPLDTNITSYTYNNNVLVVKEEVRDATPLGTVRHNFRYSYNDKGEITKVMKFKGSGQADTLMMIQYHYDEENGRLFRRDVNNFENGYKLAVTNNYSAKDERGYMTVDEEMMEHSTVVRAMGINAEGQLYEYINVKRRLRVKLYYDSDGLLTRKEFYQMPDNKLVGAINFTYKR